MASYKTIKQLDEITGINDLDFLLLYHNGVEESQENPDITGRITLQDVKELILNDIDLPTPSSALQNIRDGISGTSIEQGLLEDIESEGSSQNYACGNFSHTEGYSTQTGKWQGAKSDKNPDPDYGRGAHAEGTYTDAIGNASHAEGYGTIASGNYSHTEGYQSNTGEENAHAEGRSTTATGNASHAEGTYTTASGNASHAGGERTIAQRASQTVIGRYNSPDIQGLNQNSYGKYAFIIGNGGSERNRSNAFTVDWNGEIEANYITVSRATTNSLYSVNGAQNFNDNQVPTVDQVQDAINLASFGDSGSSDLTQTPIKIDITNIFYHQYTKMNEQLTIIFSEVDETNNKVVILDTIKIPFEYLGLWLNNSNMNLNQINGYAADKDIEYCFKTETVDNVFYFYFEVLSIPVNKQIHAQIYYKINDFYLPNYNSGGGIE